MDLDFLRVINVYAEWLITRLTIGFLMFGLVNLRLILFHVDLALYLKYFFVLIGPFSLLDSD